MLDENTDVTEQILECGIEVHRHLGPSPEYSASPSLRGPVRQEQE
jgi:hypothetical protein